MSDIKQVIVVRGDLGLKGGKLAVQVAHASVGFLAEKLCGGSNATWLNGEEGVTFNRQRNAVLSSEQLSWLTYGFKKVVLKAETLKDLLHLQECAQVTGMTVCPVIDAGLTQFGGVPTLTCIGIGPHHSEAMDILTKDYKLF